MSSIIQQPKGSYLIRGGAVITVDRAIGTLPKADVLVRDGRIEKIADGIEAEGVEVIDATDMIVMPGLIDTHYHMWSTLGRNFVSDGGYEYFQAKWATAALYDAEDFYRSVRGGRAPRAQYGGTHQHHS
jgi:cytosine/adenosine deaminase-related metal-dependent hydrolase